MESIDIRRLRIALYIRISYFCMPNEDPSLRSPTAFDTRYTATGCRPVPAIQNTTIPKLLTMPYDSVTANLIDWIS